MKELWKNVLNNFNRCSCYAGHDIGENNRQDNKGFGEFMDNISLMEVMTKYAI